MRKRKMPGPIPEIMRKLRTLKNYSQEYVAERIGVDLSTYSRYERGETSLKLEQGFKIAELYDMTVDEFYHYDDPDYNLKSPTEGWRMVPKVMVTVELDGMENSLRRIVERLTVMNKALAEPSS